jgi:5-methylcytosine-specific restriction endonuclease McrA
MREFAKDFYNSTAWRRVRAYVFLRDSYLCVKCSNLGEVVHHIVPLTPGNINDETITLDENNLETLCRDCHAAVHSTSPPAAAHLTFDKSGNLILKNENDFVY